jgi:hypothetical protein
MSDLIWIGNTMKKTKTYLFFRDKHFYPVEEDSDEKVLKHVPLNPGTTRIETIEGRVIYRAPTLQQDKTP